MMPGNRETPENTGFWPVTLPNDTKSIQLMNHSHHCKGQANGPTERQIQ